MQKSTKVRIIIYNILGQKVKDLVDLNFPSGKSKVYWDGTNDKGLSVSAGVYIYSLRTNKSSQSKKMLLLDGGNNSNGKLRFSNNQSILSRSKSIENNYIEYDTLNVYVKKDSFITVNCENLIIKQTDQEEQKDITMYRKYHLCYTNNKTVYLNTIDGNARKNISGNTNDIYNPEWSPKGRYVVFTGANGVSIYDLEMDGLKNSPLDPVNSSAEWSPNDSYILVGKTIMNLSENEKIKLPHYPNFYSNNYDYIYTQNNGIYKTDIDSTYRELLLDDIVDSLGKTNVWLDDINPDEEIILCHEDSANWTYSPYSFLLKTYNINTGKLDTILHTNENEYIVEPHFSEDYSTILYVCKPGKIMMYSKAKNKIIHQIKQDDEEVWIDNHPLKLSPEHKFIAFSKNILIPGKWFAYSSHLKIVNTQTGVSRYIDGESAKAPDWNPTIDF